tara:strand:- start:3058 stop:6168 length:3111 start_codon:yes stop_codon:yes gene_type:complete
MNIFLKFSFVVLASFTLLFTPDAISQEIEEVVITATKKEESVQDLALSVEALSAEDVESNMIDNLDDLSEVVPGLISSPGIGSGVSYAIRGTGSYGVGAAVVGAVVTAQNGHSVNTSAFGELGFFDTARIEVLKGPQGTLFGRNAVNGVINVISARPDGELGGYFDLEMGDSAHQRFTSAVNIPISDSVATRFAYTSFTRDGFSENIRTGEKFDDRNAYGFRFSLDWDISDNTRMQFTTDRYSANDNRNNIGTTYCQRSQFFGCNPLAVGNPNVVSAPSGSTAGLSNFVAGLVANAWDNTYENQIAPGDIDKAYLNRVPVREQGFEMTTLEVIHDMANDLTLNMKYSYATRDYFHMNDNDYGYSPNPFTGPLGGTLTALSAFNPSLASFSTVSFDTCFYGGMCETVDSDRTYEFSDVETWDAQGEITLISNYDGPFNFVVGAYRFDQRNHNRYLVQTAGLQGMRSFGSHPYSSINAPAIAPIVDPTTGATVFAGFPGANLTPFAAYGGLPFYQTLIFGLGGYEAPTGTPFTESPCTNADIAPIPGVFPGFDGPNLDPTGNTSLNPQCLGTMLALGQVTPYNLPTELGGYINDDHVRTLSKAIFGELYFDLNEDTKLTVGFRYNDDVVKDTIMTCLGQINCPNYSDASYASGVYTFSPTVALVADDATAGKIAIQHNLSDDSMVYASYSTAVKAGGNNPVIGTTPDPYDPEETGVLEIGTKNILMEGRLLLNAAMFMNSTKGLLVSNLENAGSVNYNLDAEINGFEGNMVFYANDTTRIDFNWLFVQSELQEGSMPDPVNPGNIVSYIGVDPTGYVEGEAGCDLSALAGLVPAAVSASPICLPGGSISEASDSVDGLPLDAAGAISYSYGLNADGETIIMAKSFGYLCATTTDNTAGLLGGFNPLGGDFCPFDPVQINVAGNTLPQSPELSYSLAVNKDFSTDNGTLSHRLVYRFQDEREGRVFNDARTVMPEHRFWDYTLRYTPNNQDWYVGLYAKNLGGDRFVSTWAASSALQGGALFATYSDPTVWGLQFGSNF